MLETVREELDLPAPSSILLSPDDNVVVATAAIAPGDRLAGGVSAVARIEPGHKAAIRRIDVGEPVVKYGQAIGRATSPIAPGEHVHSHNLAFDQGRLAIGAAVPPEAASEADKARTFSAIAGRTVGPNAQLYRHRRQRELFHHGLSPIADEANRRILPKYEGIDGFVPIVHDQGCGMSSTGDGMKNLHRTLAGYARHANFGGVLMVGLGCEVNQLTLYGQSGAGAEKRHFNIQEAGGSRRSVERALGILDEIAKEVAAARRVPIPVSEIIVGLQCGGSDGLSGITANPALGAAVDILAAAGGTAILSETSEIYGAEHLLRSRAVNETVAVKLDGLIAWWEDYVAMHGASLDNNPSPGNKRGGLTTILEKSLGAVAKGGRSPLTAVYNYAERVTEPGLVFMDTPGYDPVSATGQVAGGANVIAFTTGRGSCFGCRPAPSIKLTSNTALYRAMEEDMDMTAASLPRVKPHRRSWPGDFRAHHRDRIGPQTKSELFGYGDNEFVPWHLGATL